MVAVRALPANTLLLCEAGQFLRLSRHLDYISTWTAGALGSFTVWSRGVNREKMLYHIALWNGTRSCIPFLCFSFFFLYHYEFLFSSLSLSFSVFLSFFLSFFLQQYFFSSLSLSISLLPTLCLPLFYNCLTLSLPLSLSLPSGLL